jgi:hypothetical protein
MFTRFFTLLLPGAMVLLLATLPVRAANFTAGTAEELVAAVAQANANDEADTLTLVGDPTITLTAPLAITGELTIVGPGTLTCTGISTLIEGANVPLTLDTLTFRECLTQRGAVAVSNMTLSVTRCAFVDCTANGGEGVFAGAISGHSTHATFTDSTFTGNTTDTAAGAVAMQNGSLTVSGSAFTANASPFEDYWDGLAGAITARWCPTTLMDSAFTANTSMSLGGAVFCADEDLSLDGCTFTNNSAAFLGGAVMARTPGMEAAGCTFTGNRALMGGAIAYSSTADEEETDYRMLMTGCVFHDNSVEGRVVLDWGMAFAGGGAITTIGDAVVLNCRFTNNRARIIHASDEIEAEAIGGAVLSVSGLFGAVNCAFSANSATSVNTSAFGVAQANGGAIGTFDDGYYELHALSCTFSGNTANASATAPEMASTLGGGITLAGPVHMRNCILWGNLANGAPNQTEFVVGDWPYQYVKYCDIQSGIWAGMGNIDADPAFVRAPGPGEDGAWGTTDDDAGDLALKANSPCIDMGSNEFVYTNFMTTDLAGNPRIANDIVDMGAYEFQEYTPQQAIMDLQGAVQDLVDGGVKLPANGQSLQSKLQEALAFLADGDLENARGAIGAFINQVNAFLKTGKLTQEQADNLLAAANAVLTMLD